MGITPPRDERKKACDRTVTSFMQKLIQDQDAYSKFAWDGDHYIVSLRSGAIYHITPEGWELQSTD